MQYLLKFYSSGNSNYVEDFIFSTEEFTQAKILRSLDLIRKYGRAAGMPRVRKLAKDLLELRIRGKQQVRLIFKQKGNEIYFLHGFVKKTNKTPTNEIKLAKKRFMLKGNFKPNIKKFNANCVRAIKVSLKRI